MHLDRNKNLERMEILYLVAGVTLNACRKNKLPVLNSTEFNMAHEPPLGPHR